MAQKSSRTYKLRLSDEGIDRFLACHGRLARLTREFVPYGTTLHTTVALLDRMELCEIAAELADPMCDRFAGDRVRFVGCSQQLVDLTARLIDRINASDEMGKSPAVGKLYLAALLAFESAEDGDVLAAFHAIR